MKLDRQEFAIKSFAEADNKRAYWLTKTPKERMVAAWIFSCRMYRLNPDDRQSVKLDKSYFRMRKRK